MTHRARPARRCRGFTIVEILIALALSAIVIVAVGYALQSASQSARSNSHILDTRQQAINGLNFIMSAIRQAKMIYVYDDAGNQLTPTAGTDTGPKLKTVKEIDPSNYSELVHSTFDLDTRGGKSYLRVTNESGISDPALDSVTSLSFKVPLEPGDDYTRRKVTVTMDVRIVDPMAPNDLSKAKTLHLEGTEVARCIIKP